MTEIHVLSKFIKRTALDVNTDHCQDLKKNTLEALLNFIQILLHEFEMSSIEVLDKKITHVDMFWKAISSLYAIKTTNESVVELDFLNKKKEFLFYKYNIALCIRNTHCNGDCPLDLLYDLYYSIKPEIEETERNIEHIPYMALSIIENIAIDFNDTLFTESRKWHDSQNKAGRAIRDGLDFIKSEDGSITIDVKND